ncbi:probable jasmonic acid carboxyl methyltransferase 2 isoform X1 [Lotus japonicus]|uniref:probable jasmonic acid carboxyl methyltransferase 2 isoform X1 n=1 Tax=Lotus japonicus TaxID=34305 RepID=UPI002584AE2C|nr:probable jasmonic acid carboxyl methyltransferase 2 isoform X1 [Lotus japonicus]
MSTKQVLHMNTGVGEASYANNSTLQRKVLFEMKSILEESIKTLLHHTTFKSNLKVADLGCSSGPNSLLVVSDIMSVINTTRLGSKQEVPILQVYLSDLFGNDFNGIFKLLPDFYQKIQDRGDKAGACFINATPGNFYGRLFPNNYIDFFHSSNSLHWLSQSPEELTKGAEPLNKGHIYLTIKSPKIVYKAYFEQFQRDFNLFLRSRSNELTLDGSMVLSLLGRENAAFEKGTTQDLIELVLKDMVLEGLLEETKLDCFNMPIYIPTVEEVKQIIEAEGSFTLQTLKTIQISLDGHLPHDMDTKIKGELISKTLRSVVEPLYSAAFGKGIMDELFSRFAHKISQAIEFEKLHYTTLIMSMTKVT